jgi:hypothetical protein
MKYCTCCMSYVSDDYVESCHNDGYCKLADASVKTLKAIEEYKKNNPSSSNKIAMSVLIEYLKD